MYFLAARFPVQAFLGTSAWFFAVVNVSKLPFSFGLGLITRVAPALNAFAMGFPVKILLTLLLAGAVYVAFPGIVDALATQAFRLMQGVTP